jgi:uncharacterized protein involved in exopolysaccharide biosynthesis
MSEFYLKDYLNLLVNKKKMIISGALICMLLAALVSLVLPNIYQAKAIVYVFSPEVKTEFAPSDASVDINQGRPELEKLYNFRGTIEEASFSINAFCELAESPEILKQLIDRLGLKDITIEDLGRKMLKARLLEVYGSLSQRTYAPIIRLTAEADNKKLAQGLANTWAQILVEKINKISNYKIEEDYKFILDELAISRNNLNASERALMDFEKVSDTPVLEMELKARKEDFLAYNLQLNKVRLSLQEKDAFKAQEGYFLDLLDKTKKDIARLQSEIYQKQYQLTQLKRDTDINRISYELLQQKKEQFKISNVERAAKAKVIASAAQPQKHIRPMRGLTVAIAGFLGLIMMCLWVMVKRP